MDESGQHFGQYIEPSPLVVCQNVDRVGLAEYGFCFGSNFNFQIDTFCSGEELLMEIDQSGMYQIVFLDIELTEMNGIRVAVQLRKQYPSMLLVFVSGYSEYYRAAFDVQPFQFLDKPVNEQTFLPLLDRIICHVRNNMEILPFYYNRTYYAINIGDIIYLESNRRVITAVCVSGIFEFYDKLENLEKYLEEHQQHFVRIHKSYLVNTSHIRELRYSEVIMSNGMELAISRDNKKYVREYYMDWIGGAGI